MDLLLEWLHLALRWTHVIAAIMWIGDSFLFMWMDSSLVPPSRPREGAVAGELWMVHSGGFYEVVKRRSLAPHEMPKSLHWFKWQAYGTWISGFFLLGIVYYFGGGVFLVDRTTVALGVHTSIAISLGSLAAGWFVYDALWSSPLGRRPAIASAISFALVVLAAWGYARVFSGRAAYIHVGAMLGTIMVANVWRRIIPAQTQMLAATRAGTTVDTSLGVRAKTRSIHNHYMTLPVLFTMLSNHFPSTYGNPQAWLVLVLIVIVGAVAKYAMNFGARGNRWILAAGAAALIAAVALTGRTGAPSASAQAAALPGAAPVPFSEVQAILERRCVTCHSEHPSHPSFPQPPSGIVLEDPRRIRALSARIVARAVVTKTMPLGNLTGMSEEERQTLGVWSAQGASIAGARPRGSHGP